jgi:hypothetical protein
MTEETLMKARKIVNKISEKVANPQMLDTPTESSFASMDD